MIFSLYYSSLHSFFPFLTSASDDFDSKDLQSCVIQPSLKLQGTLSRAVKPSLSDIPSTPGSEKIIDAAATTAYWFSRENLKTDSCFIMDCGVELFFWIGKNSSISLRKTATEMLAVS